MQISTNLTQLKKADLEALRKSMGIFMARSVKENQEYTRGKTLDARGQSGKMNIQ